MPARASARVAQAWPSLSAPPAYWVDPNQLSCSHSFQLPSPPALNACPSFRYQAKYVHVMKPA